MYSRPVSCGISVNVLFSKSYIDACVVYHVCPVLSCCSNLEIAASITGVKSSTGDDIVMSLYTGLKSPTYSKYQNGGVALLYA